MPKGVFLLLIAAAQILNSDLILRSIKRGGSGGGSLGVPGQSSPCLRDGLSKRRIAGAKCAFMDSCVPRVFVSKATPKIDHHEVTMKARNWGGSGGGQDGWSDRL